MGDITKIGVFSCWDLINFIKAMIPGLKVRSFNEEDPYMFIPKHKVIRSACMLPIVVAIKGSRCHWPP